MAEQKRDKHDNVLAVKNIARQYYNNSLSLPKRTAIRRRKINILGIILEKLCK